MDALAVSVALLLYVPCAVRPLIVGNLLTPTGQNSASASKMAEGAEGHW